MKALYLTFLFALFFAFNIHAQVKWDGEASDDWSNPLNWDNDMLPTASDDVIISGATVTIPASMGSAPMVHSVMLDGGSLEIEDGVGLEINGQGTGTAPGLFIIGGTVTNNGTLVVESTNGTAVLIEGGVLNIGPTGTLGVSDVGNTGNGIENNGDVSNSGTISLTDIEEIAIYNNSTFTNSGYINMSSNGTDLNNTGSFNASGGSSLALTTPSSSSGTFNNEGELVLNTEFANGGTFNSNNGSLVNINSGGEFTNSGIFNLNGGGYYSVNIPGGALPGGTFNWTGGNVVVASSASLSINTSVTIPIMGMMIVEGTVTNIAGSTLTVNGTLQNMGGITNSGTIAGNGTIENMVGTFTNIVPAAIAPAGNGSAGTLMVSGDFDLGAATLLADINGAGTYDVLDISGTADLSSAKVTVNWLSNPTGTSNYPVIAYLSRMGMVSDANVTVPPVSGFNMDSGHMADGFYVIAQMSLPVELLTFTGRGIDQTAYLEWKTASELNNLGFGVQRSPDGEHWQTLGFVSGNGTSTTAHDYDFVDEKPLSGINYYRLQQEDFDGSMEASYVIDVEMDREDDSISISPNPATTGSLLNLTFESGSTGDATLTLYDIMGKKVKAQALTLEGGTFRTGLDLGGVPAGAYLLVISAGGESWQARLVVE